MLRFSMRFIHLFRRTLTTTAKNNIAMSHPTFQRLSFWQAPKQTPRESSFMLMKHFLLEHLSDKENQIISHDFVKYPRNQPAVQGLALVKAHISQCRTDADLAKVLSFRCIQQQLDEHTDLLVFQNNQFDFSAFKKQVLSFAIDKIKPPRQGFY